MIQLTLSGHLCADPRINETPSGAKVANLRVAGNYSAIEVAGELQERHWTDKDGNARTNLVIRNAQWSFPPKSDGAGNGDAQPRQAAQQKAAAPAPAPLSAGDFADADIPF